tara:strand:+ start:715 stop:1428 length:714 start_codon:yes stop_codon:yes gene_type:complete
MIKKTLLFVYDFPHAKSVRFLRKLKESDIKIDVIVSASYKTIKKTKRLYDFHKYNSTSDHPKDLAKKFKIPYFNLDHNSSEVKKIIIDYKINFGIIAGARILSQEIIKLFSYGILNIHPGLLPQNRGLDSILWAIKKNYKIGISAHLINDKIDAGRLILNQVVVPKKNDNIFDIYKKVFEAQINILPIAYNEINLNKTYEILKTLDYNSYMTVTTQENTLNNLKSYIANYSKISFDE